MFISAYQQYIFAYQHLCLSLFLSVGCFCNTQIKLLISCYFLADFWQVFLHKISKKISPEKQKLNAKSLLRARPPHELNFRNALLLRSLLYCLLRWCLAISSTSASNKSYLVPKSIKKKITVGLVA